ncbi:Hypothetical predicted protein [Mytilus galloprovincialis]|uniref:Uncharacterized protein n=1 Tax=Mytilus galloprovincialis TaxID=29158 RepID=A0A8B6BX39_MYTGA|nr:Hypothetical predicted protein [Mytilus galloprovincialis]
MPWPSECLSQTMDRLCCAYTESISDVHTENLSRCLSGRNKTLLPKLKAFFTKALLPELASPREGKSPGIREPGIWKKDEKQNPRPDTSSDSETANTQAKEPAQNRLTRGRQKQTKFVGRSIKQQWIIDEDANHKEWYKGTVVSLLKGTDGKLNAVYEVLFDGDDDVYEIDHLVADYHSGSVQFCDL